MKAVVYHGPGDVRLEDVAEPSVGPDELLISVATVGICGTDIGEFTHDPLFFPVREAHPVTGKVGPTIPGHEFSGRVVDVGEDVEGFVVGDLITSGSGVWCDECPPCRAGRTNMCERYWTVGLHDDGALAELVSVPAKCVFNLSGRDMQEDVAALVQPMSIAVHATRRGRLELSDVAVVIGSGGIGTFIAYVASLQGVEVLAVDLDKRRLEVAATIGAEKTLQATPDTDLSAEIRDIVGVPSIVFECTATPSGLESALRAVADNGRVVVVGHQPDPVTLDVKRISFGEVDVVGTMAHQFATDLPLAVALLESSGAEVFNIAPSVYPLADVVISGYQAMAEGRQAQIKTLFAPDLTAERPLRFS